MDIALGPDPSRDEIFDAFLNGKTCHGTGEPFRLIASATEKVPPALVQIILSLARADSGQGSFTLVSPSPALCDAFQAMGLFSDFMTISME